MGLQHPLFVEHISELHLQLVSQRGLGGNYLHSILSGWHQHVQGWHQGAFFQDISNRLAIGRS